MGPRYSPRAVVLVVLLASQAVGRAQVLPPESSRSQVPHAFIENRGQVLDVTGRAASDVLFVTESAGLKIYLRRTGITYVFMRPRSSSAPSAVDAVADRLVSNWQRYRLDVEFESIDRGCTVDGIGLLPGIRRYYRRSGTGSAPQVRSYERVVYRGIRAGKDLVISTGRDGIHYEFFGAASSERDVGFRFTGAREVQRDANGTYRATTPLGSAVLRSSHVEITTAVLGEKESRRTLSLESGVDWSTYIGGNGEDQAFGGYWGGQVGRSADGTITTWMITTSDDLPLAIGALEDEVTGVHDLVATRVSSDGSTLIWSVTFAGPGDELGGSIDVDAGGEVVAGGHTFGGLPATAGAHQRDYSGGNGDGFVARLNNDGELLWLTYLGGSGDDEVIGVSLDDDRGVSVTLGTTSPGLATPGAHCTEKKGDLVARFTPQGRLRWATYSGGAGLFGAIGTDARGDVYVTGNTTGNEFATTWCVGRKVSGMTDAIVARFSRDGVLQWASCVGGSDIDWSGGIAVASSGMVFFTGTTLSSDLPTSTGALQKLYQGGGWDGVIGCLSADGRVRWLTYCGGSGDDWLGGIAVAENGQITAVGRTASANFPITSTAYQRTLRGEYDGVVLRLDSAGRLLWSSYLGGTHPHHAYERIASVCVAGPWTTVYGSTSCVDFPTTAGVMQPEYGGGRRDCFLAQLCLSTPTITASGTDICPGDSVVLSAPVGLRCVWSTGESTPTIVVRDPGAYWFRGVDGICSAYSDTVVVHMLPSPVVAIEASGGSVLCDDRPVLLDAGLHARYRWTTGESTRFITVAVPGNYGVTVDDGLSCTGSASIDVRRASDAPVPVRLSARGICPGDSVWIEAPAGFAEYRWNGGWKGRGFFMRERGRVWLEAIDSNGCLRRSDTIDVNAFEPRPLAITGPVSRAICEGDTAVLSGPAGYMSYAWSTGETAPAIRIARPGTYTLRAIDTNGCAQQADFALAVHARPDPRLTLRGAVFLCEGDSIALALTEEYASVIWSDSSVSPVMRVVRTGMYFATVVDSNGCRGSSDTLHVTTVQRPRIELVGETRGCAGLPVRYRLMPRSGIRYNWTVVGGRTVATSGDSVIDVLWSDAVLGSIIVEAIDSSTGCGASKVLEVTVSAAPVPSPIAIGSTRFCEGDSVVLDAGTDYVAYLWSNGAQSRRISVRESGGYWVRVTDSSGCEGVSVPIAVEVQRPAIPEISEEREELVSTEAIAYQWMRDGSPIAGANARRHRPQRSGEYSVRTIDNSGCAAVSAPHNVTFLASALVALPELYAHPGDIVRIQLTLRSAVNLPQVGATTCTAVLRFDRRMLMPQADSLRGAIEEEDRLVTLRGRYVEGDSVVAELFATVALSDTAATPLHLESFSWDDAPVAVTTVDGSVTILPKGGWAALLQTERLAVADPFPNPAVSQTEIGYTLIEPGLVRLTLHDPLGRLLEVLVNAFMVPGRYSLTKDTRGMPSGAYRIELRTESGRAGRTLRVVR